MEVSFGGNVLRSVSRALARVNVVVFPYAVQFVRGVCGTNTRAYLV